MALMFKVVRVDMNGFLGRDFHPSPSDVGQMVVAVKMETEIMDGDFNPNMEPSDAEVMVELAKVFEDREGEELHMYQVWTCYTADGRKLELMDFEIELVSSNA